MSKMEDQFSLQLRAHKMDLYFLREHRFHPARQWRLDFADPIRKISIELQGGVFGKKSGHNTGKGIINDMRKNNEAQRLGWKIFHFYIDDVTSGTAVLYILDIMRELIPELRPQKKK